MCSSSSGNPHRSVHWFHWMKPGYFYKKRTEESSALHEHQWTEQSHTKFTMKEKAKKKKSWLSKNMNKIIKENIKNKDQSTKINKGKVTKHGRQSDSHN